MGNAIAVLVDVNMSGVEANDHLLWGFLDVPRSVMVQMGMGLLLYSLVKLAVMRWWRTGEEKSVYGLQHGRLHVQLPTAMWMNMGYWKKKDCKGEGKMMLAEACRDLLKVVLAEAGFGREVEGEEGGQKRRCLIDLGFGCGDQTIYLMSDKPVRACDEEWWDGREHCVRFDEYIGITKDAVQAQYAGERVEQLKHSLSTPPHNIKESTTPNINLFCADAANPSSWDHQIQTAINHTKGNSTEHWVLALDTAYHFSPSRWPLLYYIHSDLNASFMAFDLCLSPTATFTQRLTLRILTTLMGAPLANFVKPQEYRERLVQAGYHTDNITITDISEHVFTPLATFLGGQDKRLKVLGLGIGSFSVAKMMFGCWGRTGVVRGVVVVAKR